VQACSSPIGWGGVMGVAKGGGKGAMPPKWLEFIVIFCFERRYPKQNSAFCLKSNILVPPNFCAVYATGRGMKGIA